MMVVLCSVVFWLRTSSAIDPSFLSGLHKESLICSYFWLALLIKTFCSFY